MTDFHFISHGSVARVEAVSPEAQAFAEDHFPVDSWQGTPTCFTTDWRAARDLAARLATEGWRIVVP